MARRKREAAPEAQAVIAESELLSVMNDRDELKGLKEEVKTLERTLELKEGQLLVRLKAGAVVEGRIAATIETKKGQCRPKWKEAFRALAARLGLSPDVEETRVQDETPVEDKEVLVLKESFKLTAP